MQINKIGYIQPWEEGHFKRVYLLSYLLSEGMGLTKSDHPQNKAFLERKIKVLYELEEYQEVRQVYSKAGKD